MCSKAFGVGSNGFPKKEKRKIVEMNSGFTEGTAFRGRLLLALDTQRATNGKLAKAAISPPSVVPPTQEYTAYLE